MRSITYFLLLYILSCQTYASDQWWDIDTVEDQLDFVIGYGTLVNTQSRARSADEQQLVIPVRVSSQFGHRRVWNTLITGKFTSLGVEPAKAEFADTINGILYPAWPKDLESLDAREKHYDRIAVPWEMIQSLSWVPLPTTGRAWIYVTKEAHRLHPTREEPILQSYIDTCIDGFLEYGEAFAQEFLDTTSDWSVHWLNDRLIARRPWIHYPNAIYVDKLLSTYPKGDRNMYDVRKYPSSYSEEQ